MTTPIEDNQELDIDPISYEGICNPVTLECGHLFDYETLINWMVRSDNCPMCRQKIDTDFVMKQNKKYVSDKVNEINSHNLEKKEKEKNHIEDEFKKIANYYKGNDDKQLFVGSWLTYLHFLNRLKEQILNDIANLKSAIENSELYMTKTMSLEFLSLNHSWHDPIHLTNERPMIRQKISKILDECNSVFNNDNHRNCYVYYIEWNIYKLSNNLNDYLDESSLRSKLINEFDLINLKKRRPCIND